MVLSKVLPSKYQWMRNNNHELILFITPDDPLLSNHFKPLKRTKLMAEIQFFNLGIYEMILAIVVLGVMIYLLRLIIFRNKN